MSVINQVLKNLDRKGAAPAGLSGVLAVQTRLDTPRPRWPWGVLLIAVLAGAAWFRPEARVPAPAPAAAQAPAEAAPRLRLSQTLSAPEPTLPPVPSPPAPATLPAEPTRPAVAPSAPQPLGDSPAPLAVRLDTRLPEARPPRVVKETRPQTPGEQADQAWRQAARLIEQGRGPAALEGLEAALRLDPGHGPARQSLIALSLEGSGMAHDVARAEALLREGLQWHPVDAWYSRALGQLYLQRGDTALAASTLKSGLGRNVDAGYWGLYAGVLGKAGRHEEAVPAYREACRRNPAHGPWWVGLAVALEQTGAREQAGAAYRQALQTTLNGELREFAARKAAELAP